MSNHMGVPRFERVEAEAVNEGNRQYMTATIHTDGPLPTEESIVIVLTWIGDDDLAVGTTRIAIVPNGDRSAAHTFNGTTRNIEQLVVDRKPINAIPLEFDWIHELEAVDSVRVSAACETKRGVESESVPAQLRRAAVA